MSLDTAIKILIGAVAAFLVGGFAILFIKSNINQAEKIANDTNKQISVFADSQYTKYDGELITGSDVINCIKQFSKYQIFVTVDNGVQETTYIRTTDLKNKSDADIKNAKSKTNLSLYINPNADFLGEVIYDETGTDTIMGLRFVKQSS